MNGLADGTIIHGPSMSRSAAILMAVDANFSVLAIAGYGLFLQRDPFTIFQFYPSLLILAVVFPVSLYLAGLYNINRCRRYKDCASRVIVAVAGTLVVYGSVHYFIWHRDDLTKLLAVMTVALSAEALGVRIFTAVKANREKVQRTALVVGGGWAGRQVVDTIYRHPQLRIRIAGFIDDSIQKRNFLYKGIPVLGNRHSLKEIAATHRADLVIMAISYAQSTELINNLLELKMKGLEIVDMPAFYEAVTGQIPIKHVDDFWFIYSGGFEILHNPLKRRLKRLADVILAAILLMLSLPLMLLVAILIKIDSRGPVFYRQERVGYNGMLFQVVKFRSMRRDAEVESGPVWASPSDYRVTRIGRLLRLTRLDEVPQFFNVLCGEMSFVGPRPERPFFVEKLNKEVPYYGFRFTVKPGLTGWAQVNYHYGSSTEDAIEKLKYDLYYIKNMSPMMDLRILLKTFQVVLFARGT